MRMIGQRMGAPTTVATRMSVILRSDGFEFVFTFCWYASSCLSDQNVAAAAAPNALRKPRRLPAAGRPRSAFTESFISESPFLPEFYRSRGNNRYELPLLLRLLDGRDGRI